MDRTGPVLIEPRRHAPNGSHSQLWAVLHQRCPECRRGFVFRGRFAMNNLCPACGLKFEREPGYFLGAMYVSYALATVIVGLSAGLSAALLPELEPWWMMGIALIVLVPFVPVIFRYSRIIWMTIDRAIDRRD